MRTMHAAGPSRMQSRQPPIRGQVLDARRTPSTGRPQDWLGVPVEVLAEPLLDQAGHGLAIGASGHLLVDCPDDRTHLTSSSALTPSSASAAAICCVHDLDQLFGAQRLRQVAGQELRLRRTPSRPTPGVRHRHRSGPTRCGCAASLVITAISSASLSSRACSPATSAYWIAPECHPDRGLRERVTGLHRRGEVGTQLGS